MKNRMLFTFSFFGKKRKTSHKVLPKKRKRSKIVNKKIFSPKQEKSPDIIKKDKIIIRILWGDLVSKMENNTPMWTLGEARNGCSDTVNEKSISVAIGQDNYDFLKDSGAKNLVLFDKNNSIQPEGINPFWHKPYVIKKFLEEYKEVCFLDWDNSLLKPFFIEEELWNLIYTKKEGVFNGDFQSTLMKYQTMLQSVWRRKDPTGWIEAIHKNTNEKYDCKISINTCFIYCRDINIIKNYLEVYVKKDRSDLCFFSDEAPFNYYYDKICPYSSIRKMFEDFGSYIVKHTRNMNLFQKELSNAIFRHR